MNLVDSSAWLAYFANNINAKHFAPVIEDTEQLVVPTIILTEVFKVVLRQQNENAALRVVAHIKQGKLIALNEKIALNAAGYGLQYRLPLADSIIYATAIQYQADIWTQDKDFADLPQVHYFPI